MNKYVVKLTGTNEDVSKAGQLIRSTYPKMSETLGAAFEGQPPSGPTIVRFYLEADSAQEASRSVQELIPDELDVRVAEVEDG